MALREAERSPSQGWRLFPSGGEISLRKGSISCPRGDFWCWEEKSGRRRERSPQVWGSFRSRRGELRSGRREVSPGQGLVPVEEGRAPVRPTRSLPRSGARSGRGGESSGPADEKSSQVRGSFRSRRGELRSARREVFPGQGLVPVEEGRAPVRPTRSLPRSGGASAFGARSPAWETGGRVRERRSRPIRLAGGGGSPGDGQGRAGAHRAGERAAPKEFAGASGA
jgi:hypothetical protein